MSWGASAWSLIVLLRGVERQDAPADVAACKGSHCCQRLTWRPPPSLARAPLPPTGLGVWLSATSFRVNLGWCPAVCMQDFREVQDAHDKFVHMLKMQSLIHSVKMIGHIKEVLSMARQLCGLVRGAREGGIDMESVQVRRRRRVR